MTYHINTECGSMEIDAASIDDAKTQYSNRFGFDFDDVDAIAGSYYRITDYSSGETLEEAGVENMPR